MGHLDDNKAAVPEWQKAQSTPATESTPSVTTQDPPATLQQARKFLQDDEVQKYPRDKKIDFLKSKGLSESDIQQLIAEDTDGAQTTPPPDSQHSPSDIQPNPSPTAAAEPPVSDPPTLKTPPRSTPPPPQIPNPATEPPVSDPPTLKTPPLSMPLPDVQTSPSDPPTSSSPAAESPVSDPATLKTPPRSTPPPPQFHPESDRPPIVTYPEFLTKPTRPPPLITVNRFLNTLYGFAGLSSILYGTSKFILAPMVDTLTSARIELHEQAKDDLGRLVEQLESVVSEIPVVPRKGGDGKEEEVYKDPSETDSEYDDPTELFHRDIGVQTSPPLSPTLSPNHPSNTPSPNATSTNPSETQAARLSRLVSSIRDLDRQFEGQKDDYEDIRTVLGVFKDELDEISYPAHDFVGGGFGYNREPDDEIRKMKEGIRRVKGVLLSARSFPAGR